MVVTEAWRPTAPWRGWLAARIALRTRVGPQEPPSCRAKAASMEKWLLQILHTLGVVLFLGTLTANYRIKRAGEAGSQAERAFAYRLVRGNDRTLTSAGLVLAVLAGLGLAGILKGAVARPWFFLSLGLSFITFLAWMAGMVPAAKRLDLGEGDLPALSRRWDISWWVAILTTLAVLALMYGKDAVTG